MRVRAIDPVFLHAKSDGVYLSSPRRKGRIRLHPSVAQLVLQAQGGIELDRDAAEPDALTKALGQLFELGYLVEESAEPVGEPAPWSEWGHTAWQFHMSIRDAPFVREDPEQLAKYHEALATRERPSSTKSAQEQDILLLPRVRAKMPAGFQDVLEQRRTHRDFAAAAVPLDSFATLLHYAFAPLRFADAGSLGVMQLRANASGGARHETEAYVCVFDVEGITPGLYHYDNIRHGLVLVRPEAPRELAEHLTHGQGFFETAGFGIFTTAVSARMSWKYPHPRAYRMLLQNVGHMAQVFSMTATALGLGAALTGALRDTELEEFLGTGGSEFPTFAMSCGVPLKSSDGLPARYHAPTAPFPQ